jgi:hypothetical protein
MQHLEPDPAYSPTRRPAFLVDAGLGGASESKI